MAFGDVFAGWNEAQHQHVQDVLRMQYGDFQASRDRYMKIAEDDRYPVEIRQTAAQRAMTPFVDENGNITKLSKEDKNMTFQIQPPTPPPVGVPGTQTQGAPISGGPGPVPALGEVGAATSLQSLQGTQPTSGVSIPPRVIESPQPPTRTVPFGPMSISDYAKQQSQLLSAQLGTHTQAEQEDIRARYATLQDLYRDMDPQVAAMLALKMPVTSMFGTTSVPGIQGSDLLSSPNGPKVDVFNAPIRADGVYVGSRNKMGNIVNAIPVEDPVIGGLRPGFDARTNHWVWFAEHKSGRVHIDSDIGLTPPQGVPTETFSNAPRIVQQPNGNLTLEMVPTTTTRMRGGTETPTAPTAPTTAPPAQSAPADIPEDVIQNVLRNNAWMKGDRNKAMEQLQKIPLNTPTSPVMPQPPTMSSTVTSARKSGDVIGGRALTPEQRETNQKQADALDNTISRMVDVLDSSKVLESFKSKAKVALALSPNAKSLIASDFSGLTEDEKRIATNLISLSEDVNILRAIYGVSASRGEKAFSALQAQKGEILGNVDILRGVLRNSMQSVLGQMHGINSEMTPAGRPLELTDGILRAYDILYKRDNKKVTAALRKDGWIK
jgi:hypothetical protein